MEERTHPVVMTLSLKVASDSEKLASLGQGSDARSSFQKRSRGESFFKRTGGVPDEGPYNLTGKPVPLRDSANSGSSGGIPVSTTLTLDVFAESLMQEVSFVCQVLLK